MSGGIPRVHGTLIAPKNFAGVALQDFTLMFDPSDTTSTGVYGTAGTTGEWGVGVPGGALDQIFRTSLERFATVSRVGTMTTNANSSATINFAVEALGVDSASAGNLGWGSKEDSTYSFASTAAALQAAVRDIGTTSTVYNGVTYTVHCGLAYVLPFTY
jgi:hypothetical protein